MTEREVRVVRHHHITLSVRFTPCTLTLWHTPVINNISMAFHVFQGTGLDIYVKGWSGSEERSVEELRNHTARSIHPYLDPWRCVSGFLCVCVQAAGLVLASFSRRSKTAQWISSKTDTRAYGSYY